MFVARFTASCIGGTRMDFPPPSYKSDLYARADTAVLQYAFLNVGACQTNEGTYTAVYGAGGGEDDSTAPGFPVWRY